MYIERAENMLCSLNILFLGGRGGESSAIYYWLLFQYIVVDTISIVFF